MTSSEQQRQQYERLKFLFELSVQRRQALEASGETQRRSGRRGDDYLTEEERQEFFDLARQLTGVQIVNGEVQWKGKTWQIPDS